MLCLCLRSIMAKKIPLATVKELYIALLFGVVWVVFLNKIQNSRWGINSLPFLYNCFYFIFLLDILAIFVLAANNIDKYLKYWRKTHKRTRNELITFIVSLLVILLFIAAIVLGILISNSFNSSFNGSTF